MKRHSWMKIGHGKRECVTCGLIQRMFTAEDGYNKEIEYYNKKTPAITSKKRPDCK